MPSTVREAWSAWLQREIDAAPLIGFQRAFAAVWLAYDVFDLSLSGTSLCAQWPSTLIEGAPLGLQLMQVGLIVCELSLLAGRWVPVAALASCGLRAAEQWQYFVLNDFLYYCVTVAWLAFSSARLAAHESEHGLVEQRYVPQWVRDGLLLQTGWIYLASATLKLNPAFISGEHFWVRHAYQLHVAHWPYPAFLRPWLLSMPVNAGLAWLTVISEASLGVLLWLRRGRPVALALALGIHVFAGLAMNVFFFGASLIAQVWLLFPRERAAGALALNSKRQLAPGSISD
jgi:hypothetical protein